MTVSQVSAVLQRVLAAKRGDEPLVLGICGSQGSGKTTLAEALRAELSDLRGLSVAVLSLDDLYLSSAARVRLSQEVHPLLRTRGVPGTHDVDLGLDVIQRLVSSTSTGITRIPRFDKALDEPRPVECWDEFRGRADVVIFEGWCVGAVPQSESALVAPINELERVSDPDGRWRRYVNYQLAGRYKTLFAMLDSLLLLCAPSFEIVFEWRQEQERKLASATALSGRGKIMSDDELHRFIMHYERLTRHILSEMTGRADVVLRLDAQRHATID